MWVLYSELYLCTSLIFYLNIPASNFRIDHCRSVYSGKAINISTKDAFVKVVHLVWKDLFWLWNEFLSHIFSTTTWGNGFFFAQQYSSDSFLCVLSFLISLSFTIVPDAFWFWYLIKVKSCIKKKNKLLNVCLVWTLKIYVYFTQ